jgi:galactose mutarotase-like enzyme
VCCAHELIRATESASARNLTFLDTTTVRLRGGPWQVEVWPERGGRIVSLRLGGNELLDQGIGVDVPDEVGFVAAGARGWDEMVPTIDRAPYPGPGDWEEIDLPDHGEAWRLPWAVLDQTAATARMQCFGRVLPWRLERLITLSRSTVRLAYVYENVGRLPLYAYWSAHPLFRYEQGVELDVSGGFVMPPPGGSSKVFLPVGAVESVRMAWPTGSAIEMAWDPSLTPYFAIWACNGDLGGYQHIAPEPATGGSDRPDPAAPPPLLEPGRQLTWWLEIRDRRQP